MLVAKFASLKAGALLQSCGPEKLFFIFKKITFEGKDIIAVKFFCLNLNREEVAFFSMWGNASLKVVKD